MKSYLTSHVLPPHHTVGLDSAELFGLPMVVPADFCMEYSCGPISAVGPRSFVRLLPLAPRVWTIEIGERAHPYSADNTETINNVVQVGHSAVLELYQEVIINDFFELRGTYAEPQAFPGGNSMVKVVANGDTKVVTVSNTTVQAVRDVVASLYEISGVID